MGVKKLAIMSMAVINIAVADQVIEISSGVTPSTVVGSTVVNGPFATFDANTFADADAGSAAVEITTNIHTRWPNPLTVTAEASSARWVGVNSDAQLNDSMLFAFPFTVTDSVITNATIQLTYSADDFLGNDPNGDNGIYINNISQPAVGTGSVGNGFSNEIITDVIDITSFVQPGGNVLYIYVRDVNTRGGLIAYANIQITGTKVPVIDVADPKQIPSLTLWGLLLAGSSLIGIAIRQKKK